MAEASGPGLVARPFKFVIQTFLVEEDADGEVVAEWSSDPVTFYSLSELRDWTSSLEERLAAVTLSAER